MLTLRHISVLMAHGGLGRKFQRNCNNSFCLWTTLHSAHGLFWLHDQDHSWLNWENHMGWKFNPHWPYARQKALPTVLSITLVPGTAIILTPKSRDPKIKTKTKDGPVSWVRPIPRIPRSLDPSLQSLAWPYTSLHDMGHRWAMMRETGPNSSGFQPGKGRCEHPCRHSGHAILLWAIVPLSQVQRPKKVSLFHIQLKSFRKNRFISSKIMIKRLSHLGMSLGRPWSAATMPRSREQWVAFCYSPSGQHPEGYFLYQIPLAE